MRRGDWEGRKRAGETPVRYARAGGRYAAAALSFETLRLSAISEVSESTSRSTPAGPAETSGTRTARLKPALQRQEGEEKLSTCFLD